MTLDKAFQLVCSMAWALLIFGGIINLAALMTWVERKLSAMMQDRIGPNRANIRLFGRNFTAIGLFHILADPVKLFTKEDFVPEGAHKLLHTIAPMIAMGIPFMVFTLIPFAGPLHIQWRNFTAEELHLSWLFGNDVLHLSDYTLKFVVADLDSGMLFLFAVASLAIYGVILAGWSSNNKYSFLGGLRGANQMISYEVALGVSAVGLFMVYGTLSLTGIVEGQRELLWGVIPKWGIVTQFPAFFLFLACGMAEIKRIPFDLPEGESELVAGYFTEYSSLKFTMFMFGEFVEMILLSAVITTLFLGGYDIPGLSASGFHWWFIDISWEPTTTAGIIVCALQALKFTVTLLVVLYLIFVARWTFPRFRYDQVMNMGWKMVLPLALLNIVGTGVVLAITRGFV